MKKLLFGREKPRDQPHDHGQSSPPLPPGASAPSPYPVAPGNQKLGSGFWGSGEERVREKERERAEWEQASDMGDEGNELTRKIGFLTATTSEDWTLVLDVCDRASATEANAKEAVRALRREFKYGKPTAQLAAARLWAIMLPNSSETFISQSSSRKFLDTLEDLLTSSRTAPVVRERVMDVLAAAAYASGSKKDTGFRGLWRRVKPSDKPEEGVAFDTEDAMFNPPLIRASQRAAALDDDSNTMTANATRYDYAASANARYDPNAPLPPLPEVALVDTFLDSQEKRATLLARGLSAAELRDALRLREQHICTSLLAVLGSHDAKCEVLLLQGTRARSFLDAVQAVLDRGSLPSAADTSRARRLITRLSEARDQLPSSLFITGVTDHDEHMTFSGGFGDIYRASYNGMTVALKRIRMFQGSTDSPRNRLQFCRETLVWQTLRHQYVLPLIGIDRETFPSLCLVSPWMQHGTILRYLSEHGRADVDKMLLQIAEGLAYLHSMKIVHGDLRGTNILVSDDWNACLADFGLTGVIEDAASTTGGALTSTSNHAGSVRWFAPELIAPTTFGCERFMRTTESDVYAFACVCLELYTGRPPFFEVSPEIAAMLKVIADERPSRPESMSDDLWDLVTAAWAQNFRERPGTEKIIESLTTLLDPKDLQEKDQRTSDD